MLYFNPLTPRGVRRQPSFAVCGVTLFQSTHPAWGETQCVAQPRHKLHHFNPLTPRGVRHLCAYNAERHLQFQSTHPAWGETANVTEESTYQMFILHNYRFEATHYSLHYCKKCMPLSDYLVRTLLVNHVHYSFAQLNHQSFFRGICVLYSDMDYLVVIIIFMKLYDITYTI